MDASAIFIPIQYRSKCVICLVDDDPVSADGGGGRDCFGLMCCPIGSGRIDSAQIREGAQNNRKNVFTLVLFESFYLLSQC